MRGGEVFVRRTPWTGPVDGADGPRERALYVHGLGGASTNWTDLAALLAVRFDGWAVDLPGFGARSRRRGGGTRSAGTCGAVIDVLEHIVEQPGDGAGRPVHLLGNSLGGLVSLLVAGRRPDLVASLTLDLAGHAGLPRAAGVQPGAAPAPGAGHPVAGRPADRRHHAGGERPGDGPDVLRRAEPGAAGAAGAGRRGDARAGRAAVGRPRADPQHARADHLLPEGRRDQRVAGGADAGPPTLVMWGDGTSWSTPRSRRGSRPSFPTPACWCSTASGTWRCSRRPRRPRGRCSGWSRSGRGADECGDGRGRGNVPVTPRLRPTRHGA